MTIDYSEIPVASVFGSNCFSNAIMAERLPKSIYKELLAVQRGEKQLTLDVAEVVAASMRDWALAKGATHYTHWFHPLTGTTAEKHDSFVSVDTKGTVLMEFSGKELIKGESDASSFPSGGLRATFEARGYTAWDVTSPAFLKQDASGTTLCIPTAFFGYHGHALDKKVPLLRSLETLNRQALRVLRALGNKNTQRVFSTMGAEQEYFLIDAELFKKRPDLQLTGRTLMGRLSLKGQDTAHHYYGAIKERVAAFMRELNHELWKVGVAAKTQHNEVAPNQFEIAPIYSSSPVAVDGNQLIMELLKKIARRHGMEALLHEKPFAGVNGSGKHNNWSLNTDDGMNLLEPGDNPSSNARFLLFTCAVVEAVDRYASLLRCAAANSGNDHRLGGHEAPPAIISIFLGSEIQSILESIAGGAKHTSKRHVAIQLGVTSMPALPQDVSDRNRTSPFAFTGNKFEFRMIGSSQSVAPPNTYINVAVAQVLSEYADILEQASDSNEAIKKIISTSYKKHKRIVFDGNGYSDEWIQEAARRGLSNINTTVAALDALSDASIKDLFIRHAVYTAEELDSRYIIYLERYINELRVESSVLLSMVRRSVIPCVSARIAQLSNEAASLRAVSLEPAIPLGLAQSMLLLMQKLQVSTQELDTALITNTHFSTLREQAEHCNAVLYPLAESIRRFCEDLEQEMPISSWPFPSYEDLLFSL